MKKKKKEKVTKYFTYNDLINHLPLLRDEEVPDWWNHVLASLCLGYVKAEKTRKELVLIDTDLMHRLAEHLDGGDCYRYDCRELQCASCMLGGKYVSETEQSKLATYENQGIIDSRKYIVFDMASEDQNRFIKKLEEFAFSVW